MSLDNVGSRNASHGIVAKVILLFLFSNFRTSTALFPAMPWHSRATAKAMARTSCCRNAIPKDNYDSEFILIGNADQRPLTRKQTASAIFGIGILFTTLLLSQPAKASPSRTDGYKVQKSEEEWRSMLSDIQYQILRKGGTERPGFSILLEEKRTGIFRCAGCGDALFLSTDKFNSGTGWPSFARPLEGVEIERKNPIVASLSGAELRCADCGGHLGDVFQDGYLFLGTEAAVTGQRFCIDGAALVFYPENGDSPVRGDRPAKRSSGFFG